VVGQGYEYQEERIKGATTELSTVDPADPLMAALLILRLLSECENKHPYSLNWIFQLIVLGLFHSMELVKPLNKPKSQIRPFLFVPQLVGIHSPISEIGRHFLNPFQLKPPPKLHIYFISPFWRLLWPFF
jgi:hypothetical protein